MNSGGLVGKFRKYQRRLTQSPALQLKKCSFKRTQVHQQSSRYLQLTFASRYTVAVLVCLACIAIVIAGRCIVILQQEEGGGNCNQFTVSLFLPSGDSLSPLSIVTRAAGQFDQLILCIKWSESFAPKRLTNPCKLFSRNSSINPETLCNADRPQ